MNMLTLPGDRERSIDLLSTLSDAHVRMFLTDLLTAVWDAANEGDLSPHVRKAVRGWLAHAFFENDPVTQERLAKVRAGKGSE